MGSNALRLLAAGTARTAAATGCRHCRPARQLLEAGTACLIDVGYAVIHDDWRIAVGGMPVINEKAFSACEHSMAAVQIIRHLQIDFFVCLFAGSFV